MAYLGEDRVVYRVLVGKPEGKNHWGDLGVDGWIILGWTCGEKGCIGSWWGNWRERDHFCHTTSNIIHKGDIYFGT